MYFIDNLDECITTIMFNILAQFFFFGKAQIFHGMIGY